MYGLRVFSVFCFVAVTPLRGEHLSCPFASIPDLDYSSLLQPLPQAPIASASSSSYSVIDHPNSLQKYDDSQNLNLPVSTWLQRFLMTTDDAGVLPHGSQVSENMIFKSYFNEAKGSNPVCAVAPENCSNDTSNLYYRSIDGSCNNLENPGFGMTRSRYGRLVPPKYGGNNGYAPSTSISGAPLPNARLLSLELYGDVSVPDDRLTLAFMQWGQIVAHDISRLTTKGAPDDCCSNVGHKMCYPIALHPFGPIKKGSSKTCLAFKRAVSDVDGSCEHHPNYAEKISTVTSFLDLSSIYGSSKKENEIVRQYSGGLLKTSFANDRQWLPVSNNLEGECGKNNFKCYALPDRRNQFIPSITIIQTILLREHNRIACALAQLNPEYSDEKLYQEAKKINTAQYQKIIYNDWLPHFIGPSFAYANQLINYIQGGEYVNDYNPLIDPAPYAESAAAAFRYAHTQIPGFFSLVSESRTYNETKRLSDFFEKPSNMDFLSEGDNFDSVLRGMITQPQKRSDANIDKEIKHYFNRKINEEYGTDLKAFDIQRSRDFGLPSYNDLRQYCGLPRANDWADLISEIPIEKIEILQRIYGSPDDVDLSVGGSLEAHAPEALLGPTFQCIVGRQFQAVRFGDRFFYENENVYSGFSKEQLAEIRKVSLSALLCNNGDYLQYIQPNAFFIPHANNPLGSCNLVPQLDLSKWKSVPQNAVY